MKRIFLFFSFLIAGYLVAAQDTIPVYKRFPAVPPFTIINVADSSFYQKSDLHKKKPTMVIVFSPDCNHCQLATRDLLANVGLFRKLQIVMAAYAPFEMVSKFYNDYRIGLQPNIVMGVDKAYFLNSYYGVKNFPSVFLYNKKGEFIKSFEGTVSFTTIATFL